ncbi:MAG: glycosyltransferase family 2 protein [Bacteroidetes bacterium]|nr:glycosyltransferase family 2 protein [Bacteroidota bacterium]
MNESPLISVVIPAYNRAKTITYCLDSIVRQTYQTLEVIVVDDCSKDDTVAIVRAYPDARVRCVVLDKNSGAQAARNRGILEARGEWIAFQDSDDEWMPEKLDQQVAELRSVGFQQMTVVHTNGLIHYEDGTSKIIYSPALEPVHGKDVYGMVLTESRVLFQGLLTSKAALQNIGLLDVHVVAHQEWDTSIRLGKICTFAYLSAPYFKWHIHSGETVSRNNAKDVEGFFYIISKHWKDIEEICGQVIIRKLIYGLLRRCLDFRLWNYYDIYRKKLNPPVTIRFVLLRISRMLHINPNKLQFKKPIY